MYSFSDAQSFLEITKLNRYPSLIPSDKILNYTSLADLTSNELVCLGAINKLFKNEKQMLECYLKAVEMGNQVAMLELGEWYIGKDQSMGEKYYLMAMEGNTPESAEASYKLGLLNSKELKYFEKAATLNHVEALYKLGDFYYKSRYYNTQKETTLSEHDLDQKIYQYWLRATLKGHDKAKQDLIYFLTKNEYYENLVELYDKLGETQNIIDTIEKILSEKNKDISEYIIYTIQKIKDIDNYNISAALSFIYKSSEF